MKTRALKEKDLEILSEDFAGSENAFLVQFQGLTVVAVDDLRRKVREADGTYRVVKNTLARKATGDTRLAPLAGQFRGPTAIVIARKDPTRVAKALTEFAKTNPAVTLRVGLVEGAVLDAAGCKQLAELPSRETVLSKLLYMMNAPAQRLLSVIQGPARSLAYVVSEGSKKKEA